MADLTLTLLGGFEARLASGPPLVLGKKTQGLVAFLGVRLGQPQTRDKLAALLWGEMGEDQGRHSVRQAIFALRKALPGGGRTMFVTAGETLALDAATVDVDVAAFERLAADSAPGPLEQAATLYRGDLLEGLRVREPAFEDWLSVERDRLRSLALGALQRLMDEFLRTHAPERAVEMAQRVLALEPTREPMHRALIRLYLHMDRRAAALKQYQACEGVLARELGVKPEAETRALYDRIVEARAVTAPVAPAPARGDTRRVVLVVEDEPVTRALLEGFLTMGGYAVVAVGDGGDALFQLSRRVFDLILSDIAMPTLDGLALLEILARNHIDTPVIFLTGQPDDSLEARGLRLGAVDYMRKPVQKEVLLLRVTRALRTAGA